MPVNPSTVHREYQQNLNLPATGSTIEAGGIIRFTAANGRFQAIVVITVAVQRVIVGVLAVAGIGRGAIVILLSALLLRSISFTTTAIAAIITDEQMPLPIARVS